MMIIILLLYTVIKSTAGAALAYGDVLRDVSENGSKTGKNGSTLQGANVQLNMWRT